MRAVLVVWIGSMMVACGAGAGADSVDAAMDAAVDRCGDELEGYIEWRVGSTEGRTPCGETHGAGYTSTVYGESIPMLSCHIGGEGNVVLVRPFCFAGLEIYNIELATGATGRVSPERTWADEEPAFWVPALVVPATGDCADVDQRNKIGPTAGSWRVLQGGTWGDVVELEIWDVTYGPVDGEEISIPYGFWRVWLTDDPVRMP